MANTDAPLKDIIASQTYTIERQTVTIEKQAVSIENLTIILAAANNLR